MKTEGFEIHRFKIYEFQILESIICYLYYGDDSCFNLSDTREIEEKAKIDQFIDQLPAGGSWDFLKDSGFCKDSILNKYGNCVTARYSYEFDIVILYC